MTTCPCCSNQLLRHIRNNQRVWFCRHCWQEMPLFTTVISPLGSQLGLTQESPIHASKEQNMRTSLPFAACCSLGNVFHLQSRTSPEIPLPA
jgi:hypothetical protein